MNGSLGAFGIKTLDKLQIKSVSFWYKLGPTTIVLLSFVFCCSKWNDIFHTAWACVYWTSSRRAFVKYLSCIAVFSRVLWAFEGFYFVVSQNFSKSVFSFWLATFCGIQNVIAVVAAACAMLFQLQCFLFSFVVFVLVLIAVDCLILFCCWLFWLLFISRCITNAICFIVAINICFLISTTRFIFIPALFSSSSILWLKLIVDFMKSKKRKILASLALVLTITKKDMKNLESAPHSRCNNGRLKKFSRNFVMAWQLAENISHHAAAAA